MGVHVVYIVYPQDEKRKESEEAGTHFSIEKKKMATTRLQWEIRSRHWIIVLLDENQDGSRQINRNLVFDKANSAKTGKSLKYDRRPPFFMFDDMR